MSAVLAALLVLALLMLLAGLYIRCRLSVLLWYRNHYGELEINGEKGVENTVPPLGQASPGPGAHQCAKPPQIGSPFPHGHCLPRWEAVRCLRVPRHRPG